MAQGAEFYFYAFIVICIILGVNAIMRTTVTAVQNKDEIKVNYGDYMDCVWSTMNPAPSAWIIFFVALAMLGIGLWTVDFYGKSSMDQQFLRFRFI